MGTVSTALSAIVGSTENSDIGTPRLNPMPSRFDSAIAALKVTRPVPWSTVKKGPTLKLPNWSVVTKKHLPTSRSTTSFAGSGAFTGDP